jgi:hypothetical protein
LQFFFYFHLLDWFKINIDISDFHLFTVDNNTCHTMLAVKEMLAIKETGDQCLKLFTGFKDTGDRALKTQTSAA